MTVEVRSEAVLDQTLPEWHPCAPGECRMVSIRPNSQLVRYVEQCLVCDRIDGEALDWWAENAIKTSLSPRAQRIAVATETQPFAFVQSSGEDLVLQEVLAQALAAASASPGLGDPERLKQILTALSAEVARFQRVAVEQALRAALR